MPLTPTQLATEMDVVSASLEAVDVAPSVLSTNATLKTAALRLIASVQPWLVKAGLAGTHQPVVGEVFVAAND